MYFLHVLLDTLWGGGPHCVQLTYLRFLRGLIGTTLEVAGTALNFGFMSSSVSDFGDISSSIFLVLVFRKRTTFCGTLCFLFGVLCECVKSSGDSSFDGGKRSGAGNKNFIKRGRKY